MSNEDPVRLLVVVFTPPQDRPTAAANQAIVRVARSWDVEERDLALDVFEVPRSYTRGSELVLDRLRETRPDLFLLYDTDPTSEEYKLHHLASNYDDHPAPDADGEVREDQIIDPDAPVAFRTRLPLDGIWDKFTVERVPVRMSHKASHVFNHICFRTLQAIHDEGLPTRGGAIETPPLAPEAGTGVSSRSLERLEEETVMVLAVLRRLHPALLGDA